MLLEDKTMMINDGQSPLFPSPSSFREKRQSVDTSNYVIFQLNLREPLSNKKSTTDITLMPSSVTCSGTSESTSSIFANPSLMALSDLVSYSIFPGSSTPMATWV